MELAGLEPATSWVRYRQNDLMRSRYGFVERRSVFSNYMTFAQFGSTDGRSAQSKSNASGGHSRIARRRSRVALCALFSHPFCGRAPTGRGASGGTPLPTACRALAVRRALVGFPDRPPVQPAGGRCFLVRLRFAFRRKPLTHWASVSTFFDYRGATSTRLFLKGETPQTAACPSGLPSLPGSVSAR
jgi:hypothetical protein